MLIRQSGGQDEEHLPESPGALRAILNHALEDRLIGQNPAIRIGRFNLAKGRGRKVEFLIRDETQQFFRSGQGIRPLRYPLFLTALRAGMGLGELLGLEWEDFQFGPSEGELAYVKEQMGHSSIKVTVDTYGHLTPGEYCLGRCSR